MVIVQAGAEVINSTLRGPVIIGEGTRIIDSVVGPYASIYFDCTIVDSSIENSVILEETKIVGVKNISESLVGKQVDIHRASSDPAVRLMIGDHSVVELP
jgi:glucose-1-phosphate thymidylyltransferase